MGNFKQLFWVVLAMTATLTIRAQESSRAPAAPEVELFTSYMKCMIETQSVAIKRMFNNFSDDRYNILKLAISIQEVSLSENGERELRYRISPAFARKGRRHISVMPPARVHLDIEQSLSNGGVSFSIRHLDEDNTIEMRSFDFPYYDYVREQESHNLVVNNFGQQQEYQVNLARGISSQSQAGQAAVLLSNRASGYPVLGPNGTRISLSRRNYQRCLQKKAIALSLKHATRTEAGLWDPERVDYVKSVVAEDRTIRSQPENLNRFRFNTRAAIFYDVSGRER